MIRNENSHHDDSCEYAHEMYADQDEYASDDSDWNAEGEQIKLFCTS